MLAIKWLVALVYCILVALGSTLVLAGDQLAPTKMFPRHPWLAWAVIGFIVGLALSFAQDSRIIKSRVHRLIVLSLAGLLLLGIAMLK